MALRAAPQEATLLASTLIIQGLIPAGYLLALRLLMNGLQHPGEASVFGLIAPFGIWAGALLIQTAADPLSLLLRVRLNEKLFTHVQQEIMQKANSLKFMIGFHDPDLQNEIHYLKEEARSKPMNFVYVGAALTRELTAVSSLGILLSSFSLWLPFLLVIVSIPHAISALRLERRGWDLSLFRSPEARHLSSLARLPLDLKAAQEIRMFDFGAMLVKRFRKIAFFFHRKAAVQRTRHVRRAVGLSSLSVAGHLGIVVWLTCGAFAPRWDMAVLVVGLQALIMVQAETSQLMRSVSMLVPTLLFFKQLKKYQSYQERNTPTGAAIPLSRFERIEFDDVSFSYPGGKGVLSHVNLTIRAGERIAIVGENGAGKSTLLKLLCRLYDPTGGSIRVDGKDLRSLDVDSWRALIATVFQEHVAYDLTVRDTIAIGNPICKSSLPSLMEAAQRGRFAAVASRLPMGYRTRIGVQRDGVDLSAGEWQRLSMSRAFARDAPILAFDEPTAALDPLAEEEVLASLASATEGRTALIVTHRLGAVHLAERIIVMHGGAVVEDGPHSSLLEAGNLYARFYRAQANQFQREKRPADPVRGSG